MSPVKPYNPVQRGATPPATKAAGHPPAALGAAAGRGDRGGAVQLHAARQPGAEAGGRGSPTAGAPELELAASLSQRQIPVGGEPLALCMSPRHTPFTNISVSRYSF